MRIFDKQRLHSAKRLLFRLGIISIIQKETIGDAQSEIEVLLYSLWMLFPFFLQKTTHFFQKFRTVLPFQKFWMTKYYNPLQCLPIVPRNTPIAVKFLWRIFYFCIAVFIIDKLDKFLKAAFFRLFLQQVSSSGNAPALFTT